MAPVSGERGRTGEYAAAVGGLADATGAATGPVRCLGCGARIERSGPRSGGGSGIAACDVPSCRTAAARGDAVVAVLARLPDCVTGIEVAAASRGGSSSSIGKTLRALNDAGLVQSRERDYRSANGGRAPLVYRLTDAGHDASAASVASVASAESMAPVVSVQVATSSGSRTPDATNGPSVARTGRARGRAVGYVNAARLPISQRHRITRLLREQATAYGLDLTDVFVETEPGARQTFDRLRTALQGLGPPTVVVPSWDHLAVDERRQAAMVADLDDSGAAVISVGEVPR